MKLGDLNTLRNFLESDQNYHLLELMNQLIGYEDPEYPRFYRSNVKYEAKAEDEVMCHLFNDSSTLDWDPLIIAIFYQQLEIVKYLALFLGKQLRQLYPCIIKCILKYYCVF